MVAGTAVAMAPQQWKDPVLRRVITPAHGQAVSIAAGTYSVISNIDVATFRDIFDNDFQEFDGDSGTICGEAVGGASIITTLTFNWPGGVGPIVVPVVAAGFICRPDVGPDGNEFTVQNPGVNVNIRINLPSEIDVGEIAFASDMDPLPGGLEFLVSLPTP